MYASNRRTAKPTAPDKPGPLLKFGREVPPVRRVPIALARRFFQICTAAAAECTADANLTPQEFAVMAYINDAVGEPDIDQSSLAARLGIDHAHTSLLVDRLEARGLLERRVNGEDRRARLLRLTPKGEKLHARLYPEAFAGQHRLLEVLTICTRSIARMVRANSPSSARVWLTFWTKLVAPRVSELIRNAKNPIRATATATIAAIRAAPNDFKNPPSPFTDPNPGNVLPRQELPGSWLPSG
jgi:DNA-binding MarR family transcriptional regulator